MKVSTQGQPKAEGITPDYLREASTFFINTLLPHHLALVNTLRLGIEFIDGLESTAGQPADGLSYVMDDIVRPSEFVIELEAKLESHGMLMTLAHEMCHIAQMAQGLYFSHGGNRVWMGRPVPEDTHYYDLPWEIDAHGREVGLVERFHDRTEAVVLESIADPAADEFASLLDQLK